MTKRRRERDAADRIITEKAQGQGKKAWVKADTSSSNWYKYGTTAETKKWANAVTVKETGGSKTRAQYLTAAVGTPIPEADILGMYVWIPRYAYKIESGDNSGYHKKNAGIVDIKFLTGTSNYVEGVVEYNEETTAEYTKFPEGYVVHPAFKLGDKELEGIWVAKFEASSNTTTTDLTSNAGSSYGRQSTTADKVTIRPNVTSWRNTNVQDMYKACVAMTASGNIHGLNNADSHLMKDTE